MGAGAIISNIKSDKTNVVVKSDNGEKTVVICELPNSSYLWTSEPKKEPWAKRYKLFYGLKEDVNFRFVDRNESARILNDYKLGA